MELNKEKYVRMYAKMYHILCAAASEALDEMPETAENATAAKTLREALEEAEEIYLETAEEVEE